MPGQEFSGRERRVFHDDPDRGIRFPEVRPEGGILENYTTLLEKFPAFKRPQPWFPFVLPATMLPAEAAIISGEIAFGQMYDLQFDMAERTLRASHEISAELAQDGRPGFENFRLALLLHLEMLRGAELDSETHCPELPTVAEALEQLASGALSFSTPASAPILTGAAFDDSVSDLMSALTLYHLNFWRVLATQTAEDSLQLFQDVCAARNSLSGRPLTTALLAATAVDAGMKARVSGDTISELAHSAVSSVEQSGNLRLLPEVRIRTFKAAGLIADQATRCSAMSIELEQYREDIRRNRNQDTYDLESELLEAIVLLHGGNTEAARETLLELADDARNLLFGHLLRPTLIPSLLEKTTV